MSLSCSCDFDPDGYQWFWMDHGDFKAFTGNRRKRCCSCQSLIEIGEDSIEFFRYRNPRTDIEERIYGEGDFVPLASHFMCEECSGLYLALDELGYGCLDIGTPMKEYIAEYNDMRDNQSTRGE